MIPVDGVLLSPIERCLNEILFQIHQYLPKYERRKDTILALRLTSRRLCAFFTRLTINSPRYSWGISDSSNIIQSRGLRIYAEHSPRSCLQANSLVVPTPEAFVPFVSSLTLHFSAYISNDFYETEEAVKYIQELLEEFEPLWNDILRLKSLSSIDVWWDGEREDLPIYQPISDALLDSVFTTTGGRLSQLVWSIPSSFQVQRPFSPILLRFSGLREVSLQARTARHSWTGTQPISMLGDLILQDPELRSITLDYDSPYALCEWKELFPPGLDDSRIESIDIRGILPSVPDHLYAHAHLPKRLTFPKMWHLREISIISDQYLPPPLLDLDPLWLTLKECGIKLSVLRLHYGISDVLMEYLGSYEGLKILELSVYDILHGNTGSTPSVPFAKGVLPRHSASLTSLEISRHFVEKRPRRDWECLAFRPVTWPTPSSFLKLTWLQVPTPSDWKLNEKNCQQLLDYASEIPNLLELDVEWMVSGVTKGDLANSAQTLGKASIKRCAIKEFRILAAVPDNDCDARWDISFPYVEPAGVDGGAAERFQLNTFRFWSRYGTWEDRSDSTA